jgi:type I restriction enzyme S subunit
MSKEENKIVPQLRFPEFEKDGDWETETVNDLSKTVTAGGTPSTNKEEYWGGDIRWMNSGELNLKIVKEVVGRITKEGLKNSSTKIIPENSVLIGLAGQGKTRGTVAINKVRLCTNQSIASIYPNEDVFDSEFLYHNLDNRYNELRELSAGGEGRGGLNLKIIKEIRIPIPPKKEEQQKIAACLSSLDEVIIAETEKLDLLQHHKKGLLQQLFPTEGETQPKFRFPEFKEDGDWVQEEIGKLFKFKQGVQVPVDNQYPIKEDGMVRFIRIIDITGNSEPPRYIINPGKDHIITKEDLFMIRYGTPGAISIGFDGVIANNLFRLIWKSNNSLNSLFWFYAFQKIEKKVFSLSGSSSMPAISFSTLNNLGITYPKNLKEQQKIAACLSAADELIEAQAQKIEALQAHKKGLLQQLFPNVKE